MFLAVNVFNATLLPLPLVPQMNTWGFGREGGPNKSVYVDRCVCVHISTDKNSFIM